MIKKISIYIIICTILSSYAWNKARSSADDKDFSEAVGKWFNAWELLSKEIYHIDSLRQVDFIFFDEQYVYSTSGVTIPAGETVIGPTLLNRSFSWKKMLHHDSILLPDNHKVEVGLMSFAAEHNTATTRSYFVMPLPAFWKAAGVTSNELGFENLVTGVFIHEFSHSQQMQNFGKKMTWYENNTNFGMEFSDDIVQNMFSKDSFYVKRYNEEVSKLYDAVAATNEKNRKYLIEQAISIMQVRHVYLNRKYKELSQVDEFFLTMEGLGQFSMYAWLIHPKGANIPVDKAIQGVRRGKKWWSQDEGFALFLLLDKLSSPVHWSKPMFGNETRSVIALIKEKNK